MRNDALDHFGTRLGRRFTADQVRMLMKDVRLTGIETSSAPPYWCALGYKPTE